MRISTAVIHQQIRQLFWHLLICFGLVMILPLEEAVLNLREGGGFFSDSIWGLSIMFSPLLMGLIGCANVQADLNEKRYIFWRSKPASTKWFMTGKYFVGLITGLLIMVCPMVFAFISCWLNTQGHRIFPGLNNQQVLSCVLIGIMCYSVCFGSNVLVRRSARAWLIGMVVTCFLLVVPFMLSLGYRDFMSDVIRSISAFYLSLIIIVSVVAFVFSLFAAEHDWHLKTNLKRLLWAGFGLVFGVMLFYSSQVANIRILQEKEIEYAEPHSFNNIDGRIVLQPQNYIDFDKNAILVRKAFDDPIKILHEKYFSRLQGNKRYGVRLYPMYPGLYQRIGGELYFFELLALGKTTDTKPPYEYEKLFLSSFKLVNTHWEQASELEISDCLRGKSDEPVPHVHMAMRYMDNKIVAHINGTYAAIDVSEPWRLKLIDKKLGSFRRIWPSEGPKRFSLSLIPIEGMDIKERIRLSIDLPFGIFPNFNDTFRSSIVDIDGDRISFFYFTKKGLKRYEVTGWNDEKIHCKLSAERSFTMLEQISSYWGHRSFVKNGNLYTFNEHKLMVFDIHNSEQIRKLGHFVRSEFKIQDITVLENGNILMCLLYRSNFADKNVNKSYLYLLKDPR